MRKFLPVQTIFLLSLSLGNTSFGARKGFCPDDVTPRFNDEGEENKCPSPNKPEEKPSLTPIVLGSPEDANRRLEEDRRRREAEEQKPREEQKLREQQLAVQVAKDKADADAANKQNEEIQIQNGTGHRNNGEQPPSQFQPSVTIVQSPGNAVAPGAARVPSSTYEAPSNGSSQSSSGGQLNWDQQGIVDRMSEITFAIKNPEIPAPARQQMRDIMVEGAKNGVPPSTSLQKAEAVLKSVNTSILQSSTQSIDSTTLLKSTKTAGQGGSVGDINLKNEIKIDGGKNKDKKEMPQQEAKAQDLKKKEPDEELDNKGKPFDQGNPDLFAKILNGFLNGLPDVEDTKPTAHKNPGFTSPGRKVAGKDNPQVPVQTKKEDSGTEWGWLLILFGFVLAVAFIVYRSCFEKKPSQRTSSPAPKTPPSDPTPGGEKRATTPTNFGKGQKVEETAVTVAEETPPEPPTNNTYCIPRGKKR